MRPQTYGMIENFECTCPSAWDDRWSIRMRRAHSQPATARARSRIGCAQRSTIGHARLKVVGEQVIIKSIERKSR
jgi:hypothetical protein